MQRTYVYTYKHACVYLSAGWRVCARISAGITANSYGGVCLRMCGSCLRLQRHSSAFGKLFCIQLHSFVVGQLVAEGRANGQKITQENVCLMCGKFAAHNNNNNKKHKLAHLCIKQVNKHTLTYIQSNTYINYDVYLQCICCC